MLGRCLLLAVCPGMRLVPFNLAICLCHFLCVIPGMRTVPVIVVFRWCLFLDACPGIRSVPFIQCQVCGLLGATLIYLADRIRHSNVTLSAKSLGILLLLEHSLRLQGWYCS